MGAGDSNGGPESGGTPKPAESGVAARYRYELGAFLGLGGSGTVHVATRREPLTGVGEGRPEVPETVAVKMFGDDDGSSLASLNRELTALLALRHPRIPRVYDWGTQEFGSFIAMEFCPAGSLRQALRNLGQMDEATWLHLAQDMLEALVAAHAASLLHLDIKPSNILLDGAGGFLLTDFGLAESLQVRGSGGASRGIGTRGYQAPEQASQRLDEYDPRTDIWGLGATLWALATGVDLCRDSSLPRDREADGERQSLPSIALWRGDFPEELVRIVEAMTASDPSHRPGSAAEVLARIRAYCRGVPLGNDPLSVARRMKLSDSEAARVLHSLRDPLLVSVVRSSDFQRHVVRFDDGERIFREGEPASCAFMLLSGRLAVERGGGLLVIEDREGTFIGEVATLTGGARTASVRALGTVHAAAFNQAELERLIALNPPLAVRLVKSMAARLVRESRE